MADKPEIFLEIGAGFFRIPTTEVNYNITVIGGSSISSEKAVPPPPVPQFSTSSGETAGDGDDYYQAVTEDLYHDIGYLAKSLSSTLMDLPAEDRRQQRATLDEAGDKLESAKSQLQDIVTMTEKATMEIMDNVEKVQGGTGDVQSLLSDLKNHPAFAVSDNGDNAEDEDDGSVADSESLFIVELDALKGGIDAALTLLAEVNGAKEEVVEAEAPAPVTTKKRYLFDLDVIFQTLYELCTNETVKDHISGARERAADIFDPHRFLDEISEKAASYEADEDNYFNVPMSDVFQSLFAACNDKSIKNLLKKMDDGQSTIFLDQAIPLEVPEIEEVEDAPSDPVSEGEVQVEGDSRLDEVVSSLEKCKEALIRLPEVASKENSAAANCSVMSIDDQRDIFTKIESAFGVSTSITADVSKIIEVLSFQDLSGQQIMKILKLLSDFQVQLLAIVVSFGSQLKQKKENADITLEESKSLAQSDVDKYLSSISSTGDDAEAILDQDTVNNMLEEFGF